MDIAVVKILWGLSVVIWYMQVSLIKKKKKTSNEAIEFLCLLTWQCITEECIRQDNSSPTFWGLPTLLRQGIFIMHSEPDNKCSNCKWLTEVKGNVMNAFASLATTSGGGGGEVPVYFPHFAL